jgi:hypothetical protein
VIRKTDIPQLALELRRLGETLITPCPCGHHNHRHLTAHTIGEHIWDSTQAMAPGPRAQAFTPTTNTPTRTDHDTDPPPEPDMHNRYTHRANNAWTATRALQDLVDGLRPDQTAPTGPTFTDTEWCRTHLDLLGICEPRYRGDLCRRCYGVQLTTGHTPPRSILDAWRDGTRVTDQMIANAIKATQPTPTKARKRRKAG